MNRSVAWLVTITLIVVSGLTACVAPRMPHMGDYRRYANSTHGWSIAYPPDWDLDNRDPGFVTIRPPSTLRGRRGLVGIHSGSVDPGWLEIDSVDYYADKLLIASQMAAARRGQQWQTISRRSLILVDGTPAVEVVNLLGAGTVGKSRKIFILLRQRGILIDAEGYASSWQELEPYFDRIIDSFIPIGS